MTNIDIFSGFLGAGKTTLIKKLIKESFAGQKVVLIENEFGEIGIDGGFLKESGIQINELNAGCICCSLVGDFRAALQQVVEQYHPDRIVIEPSGVGKLSDVTRAVEGVAEHLDVKLNSFVTVADVNKVKMYMKNFGEFYDDQISHASCIILSRTQTASEEKIAAAVAMLREKNPTATIVTTAWDELTGEQILKAMSTKDDFKAELIAMAAKANEEQPTRTRKKSTSITIITTMRTVCAAAAIIMTMMTMMTTRMSTSIITTTTTSTIMMTIAAAATTTIMTMMTTSTSMSIITMTMTSMTTTTMSTSITTTMTVIAAAAIIITTTTLMKCSPAGAWRRPASSPRPRWSTPSPSWIPAITA